MMADEAGSSTTPAAMGGRPKPGTVLPPVVVRAVKIRVSSELATLVSVP